MRHGRRWNAAVIVDNRRAVNDDAHAGFAVAERLRATAPEHFKLLTSLPVQFRFQDKEADLLAEAPMIRLNQRNEVTAIRYNNRSLAPFTFAPELIEPYYDAYRTFGQLIASPEFQVIFKLKPGDLFIVDNERVLHGETPMTDWVRQAAVIAMQDGRICLVTSRNGRRWVLPKGLIDLGHTAGEAALASRLA